MSKLLKAIQDALMLQRAFGALAEKRAREEQKREMQIRDLSAFVTFSPQELRDVFDVWRARMPLDWDSAMGLCKFCAWSGLPMPWEIDDQKT